MRAGGVDALIDANRKKPNLKNRVDEATETAVMAFALEQPVYGQIVLIDAHRSEIETAHPGYLASQDTFYVNSLKGVGRIYR